MEMRMDDTLTAADAGLIAGRSRKLLARGRITHRQFALLDCLLWSCRKAGKATARVSYSQLQKMAHQARSTVAQGIAMLVRLGLVQRVRHRLLAVGQNGGRVWRQLPNAYRLLLGADSRESGGRTDSKTQEFTILVPVALSRNQEAAQEALKLITENRMRQRAADWLRSRQNLMF